MDAARALAAIRQTLQDLTGTLGEESEVRDLVEVGTVLSAVLNTAVDSLNEIKEKLRREALADLMDAPGSTDFEGIEIGRVSVTIPEPKLYLIDGTDPEVLRRELGGDFDLYFETKTTYAPRKNASEIVARMATGRTKDLLLCSLEEREQTPRVSFRKL